MLAQHGPRGWKRLGGITVEATAWRKATTLRYPSSCSLCPMGRWSQQPGLSSSDASTRDRPGLAVQARTKHGRGRIVSTRQCRTPASAEVRDVRRHAAAAAPEQRLRHSKARLVQPAQHDGARPAAPSAASDEVERHPRPERRRERTDPLLGEGCAARGGKGIHRSCAPSRADPYPASFVPHEVGSARGYGLIPNGKTAVPPEDVMTRGDSLPRTPAERNGGGVRVERVRPVSPDVPGIRHCSSRGTVGWRQRSERA